MRNELCLPSCRRLGLGARQGGTDLIKLPMCNQLVVCEQIPRMGTLQGEGSHGGFATPLTPPQAWWLLPSWAGESGHSPCQHSGATGAPLAAATLGGCHPPSFADPPCPSPAHPHVPGGAGAPCSSRQVVGSSSYFGVYLTLTTTPWLPQPQHSIRATGAPSRTPTQGGCQGWHSTRVPLPPQQWPCHGHNAHQHQ